MSTDQKGMLAFNAVMLVLLPVMELLAQVLPQLAPLLSAPGAKTVGVAVAVINAGVILLKAYIQIKKVPA